MPTPSAPAVAGEGALLASTAPTSHDFLVASPNALARWWDAARPAPVPAEERARILRTLPREGEVTDLDPASREKLRALTPLLRAAHRDSVYVIKVIVAAQAAVGLHARTVVLISHHALILLTATELQAIVAHEIGHEYVWSAFERASRLADYARLQDLELVCDVVAVLTMRALGGEESPLFSGLEALSRFNRDRFGAALNERAHPPLAGRRALGEAVAARLQAAGPPPSILGPARARSAAAAFDDPRP